MPGGYVPGLQPSNHRTVNQSQSQTMVQQQPGPTFLQQRGQTNFGGFGASLAQHPTSSLASQTNGSSAQHGSSSIGAPSVSSASEVGLDPNDFPALGSVTANNNNSTNNTNGTIGPNGTTSYASQAGGLAGASATNPTVGSGAATTSQPREFTPDDFPALGGQPQSTSHPENHSHPPGLNGFQPSDHRQSLLGSLTGGLQPGLLNLSGTSTRSLHSAFQTGHSEAEKQQQRNNYALKLNQTAHAAWNSSNPSSQPQSQQQQSLNLSSGAFSNPPPANGNHSTTTNPPASHLNAPPGVPPPSGAAFQTPAPNNSNPAGPGYAANGLPEQQNSTNPDNSNSLPNSTGHIQQHPQTPAQQVLMSAADRWGLMALLAMIKNAGSEMDQGLSSVGTDLGTMGLDMGYGGSLYSTFITPWADQSAAHSVEPDYHLPSCYDVRTSVPGPGKASAFSDETLFFMFFSSPRDALQEIAAQELYNRSWRYHKTLRLWITKESAGPMSKVPGGESGYYTYWDTENWIRERKEMTVLYSELEEKIQPAFGPTANTLQEAMKSVGMPGTPQPQASRGTFQQLGL
ncbi:hypothetical protein C8J56DRAFT_999587 [Mycena floridula]|nr:hypothetical protein C8J56DRAFT_999587 [Mycena floridula]